jgi:hypothetical protein
MYNYGTILVIYKGFPNEPNCEREEGFLSSLFLEGGLEPMGIYARQIFRKDSYIEGYVHFFGALGAPINELGHINNGQHEISRKNRILSKLLHVELFERINYN